MNYRYCVVYCFYILLVFTAVYCTESSQSKEEKAARNYCSSCHLFPEPSLLDKASWTKGVLPRMGSYFGIAYMGDQFYITTNNTATADSTKIIAIDYENWTAIVDYYTTHSPVKLDSQNRPRINHFTDRFIANEIVIEGSKPTTTYVKIDPGNKRIYTSNESDSLFSVFDAHLNLLSKKNIQRVIVDVQFDEDLQLPGPRNGVLTNIGIIHPNDRKTGSLDRFQIDTAALISPGVTLAERLPRPVQTTAADFNKDGKMDYLVCGFGYNNGAFYYLQNNGKDQFIQKILKPLPGAIKSYVEDYNKDGLPDIIVLFAQAQEGIYVYLNKGNGNFEIKELLLFPSVYGSTWFEMLDVNGDGLKDIVYTCGDNLDFSKVLKNYHGIYIYLNKGNDKYEQAYFFPVNGCYKALMRDFDNDGDLDIASISYFPDVINQPQESFVYLENNGGLKFTPTTIKEYNRGNWLVMDAGDVDGDGDEDIVIGSLVFNFSPGELIKNVASGTLPGFILLVNQTK